MFAEEALGSDEGPYSLCCIRSPADANPEQAPGGMAASAPRTATTTSAFPPVSTQVRGRLHLGVLFVVHWRPPSCDLRTFLWTLVMGPAWVSCIGVKEKGPCRGVTLCLPGRGDYVHGR